jgi:small subunit ribosomal protein S5
MARPTGHFGGGDRRQEGEEGFVEKVVRINRTAKVVKGGRRFGFAVLAVAGDGKGQVGIALGKAKLVPDAVRKAIDRAKRSMISIPMNKGTIPFQVIGRYGTARVILKPASKGTGVIAGGAVRAVVEAAGVRDILAKVHGSTNPVNVTRATLNALRGLRSVEELSRQRGVQLRLVVPGQPAAAIGAGREVADAR